MPVNINFNRSQGGYELANNLETTIAGVAALDAVQGYTIAKKITSLEDVMDSNRCATVIDRAGWYRFAVYNRPDSALCAAGSLGNGVEITITRAFNDIDNEMHKCALLGLYRQSRLIELYGLSHVFLITKVRHVFDETKRKAYLDLYYQHDYLNVILIQLHDAKDIDGVAWQSVTMTQVPETTATEKIYSVLELHPNAAPNLLI